MQQCLTLSQTLWPRADGADTVRRAARGAVLALVFSALIGLCAHLQIALPGTPVPVTGQTFAVLLAAALLGSRLGAATIALYLLEGRAGLPVFASAAGIASYGYLVGFLPAAALVGFMAERGWDRRPLRAALMMALGSAVIYAFGVCWLEHLVGGIWAAVVAGILPFLIGDAIKVALAATLLPIGWRLIGASKTCAP